MTERNNGMTESKDVSCQAEINEIVLKRIKFASTKWFDINEICLLEPKFDCFVNSMFESLQASMYGYLWGKEIGRQEVKYPKTWWEAFKEEYFPLWAKTIWPVKYNVVTLVAKVVFPDLKIIPDKKEFDKKIYLVEKKDYE